MRATKKTSLPKIELLSGNLYDRRSGNALEGLYKPLNKPIFRTDLKTAEMVKYASNCLLATKISYWNEIFSICKELGISSQKVADITAIDPRVGKYGSVHGKAFGGKCLPKDLKAFIDFAERDQNEKYELLREVKDISSLVDIHYIRQKEPKGLGDAILRAEKYVGDEPFAVLLGADIIKGTVPCIKQLLDIYQKHGSPVIAVEEVKDVSKYGIIKGDEIDRSVYVIKDIIEKPSPEEAPSNIGAIGRYILTPEIFDCIKKTPLGNGNETQLTDAI